MRLELPIGDSRPARIVAIDKTGQLSDLTGASAGRIQIVAHEGATPIVDKAAAIDSSLSTLTITFTQPEADALVAGSYYGRGWFTKDGARVITDRFDVDVTRVP